MDTSNLFKIGAGQTPNAPVDIASLSPAERRRVLDALLADGSMQPHVAKLEAAMRKDPGLARFFRDLRLEAGGGSRNGQFTIAEIDAAMEKAAQLHPQHYGAPEKRMAIKLQFHLAGALAKE